MKFFRVIHFIKVVIAINIGIGQLNVLIPSAYRLYKYVTFTYHLTLCSTMSPAHHHLSPCSSMVRASDWSSLEHYRLYTYVTFTQQLSPSIAKYNSLYNVTLVVDRNLLKDTHTDGVNSKSAHLFFFFHAPQILQ